MFLELKCLLSKDKTKSICLSWGSGSVNSVKQLLWQAGAQAWEDRWRPDLWATCFLFFFSLGQTGNYKESCPAMEHIHKAKLNSTASTKPLSKPCFKLTRVPQAKKNYKHKLHTGDKLPILPKPLPQTLLSSELQKETLWKSIKLVILYHYIDSVAWDCNLISGVACISVTELSWLLFFIISSLFQKDRILSAALFSFTLIDTEFNYVFLAHST